MSQARTLNQLDFVAICPECGAMVGWMSREMMDDPAEFTREIQEWTQAGLKLEQATTEESRRRIRASHSVMCSKAVEG